MTIQQAIKIIENYNLWRRDTDEKGYVMPDPTQLGIAIDVVLKFCKNMGEFDLN